MTGEQISTPEIRQPKPRQVWFIDDNEYGAINSVIKLLERNKKNFNWQYEFNHFVLAKEALKALKKIIEEKQSMPEVVFIDGNLLQDYPGLRKGSEVVAEIKKICQENKTSLPNLVAYSGDPDKNNDMLNAGAQNKIDDKTSIQELRDFLSERAKPKETNE